MKLRLVGCSTYIYKGYHFVKDGGDLQATKDDHAYLLEQKMQDGRNVFKEVHDNAAPEPLPAAASEDAPKRVSASDRVALPVKKGKSLVFNAKGEGDSAVAAQAADDAQDAPEPQDGAEDDGTMQLNGTGVKV